MSNSIVARTENIDKVVGDFQKQLQEFNKSMNIHLNDVNQMVNQLSTVWLSSDYDNFKRKMNSQSSMIKASLQRGENLDAQLGEIKKKLSLALEKLHKAGY